MFEGTSLSKPLFAFFAMSFVEEGDLDLDRPLYKYLPYSELAQDERYKKLPPVWCLATGPVCPIGVPQRKGLDSNFHLILHFVSLFG
jgi:Beta-lactamase